MNTIILLVAIATLCAYVCRLDALSWSHHKTSFLLIHLLNAVLCVWALVEAAQGRATWENAATLATAVLWLWVTFYSWRHGPPPHSRRRSTLPSEPPAPAHRAG